MFSSYQGAVLSKVPLEPPYNLTIRTGAVWICGGQNNDSGVKDTAAKLDKPEFYLWDPHSGRRGSNSASCPLTSTPMLEHGVYPHTSLATDKGPK